MQRQEIFNAISQEREYQNSKWQATDFLNSPYHWAAYIGAYTNRSLIGAPDMDPVARAARFKEDMIKVAALAVAALEV